MMDTLEDVTYIEPFVGGGAMLFYMLQHYPNIRHAVINNENPDLITCYRTVRYTRGTDSIFDGYTECLQRTLYVETTKQTDYGKEGYKYRSKGRNSSYN